MVRAFVHAHYRCMDFAALPIQRAMFAASSIDAWAQMIEGVTEAVRRRHGGKMKFGTLYIGG